jgi:hypothetical protein
MDRSAGPKGNNLRARKAFASIKKIWDDPLFYRYKIIKLKLEAPLKVLLAFLTQHVIIINGGQTIIAPNTGLETLSRGVRKILVIRSAFSIITLPTIFIF